MQTDSVGKQREGGSGFRHLSYGPEDQNSELRALTAPLWEKIGGELNARTMPSLTADQITLLAYKILRRELLEGGFVQLIQNGYGPFIFLNPFARALREWGQSLESAPVHGDTAILRDFSKWLYRARKVYERTRSLLEKPTRDQDEFMALYEKVEEWDEFDDEFVDREPEVTKAVIGAWRFRVSAQGDS